MSEPQDSESIQFDKAEFQSPEGITCGYCKNPISGEYFLVGGSTWCPACRYGLDSPERTSTSGGGRMLTAAAYGLGAAVAGSALYFGILWITGGWEFSLIAIVVGWLVGRAVMTGSGNRGGVGYQLMAVFLTYCSIASSFMPLILEGAETVGAAELLVAFILAFAAPFLGGLDNILGLLIIGIGLWQAWSMTKKRQLEIEGPYSAAK